MVADADVDDALPDLLDHARSLVAHHGRRRQLPLPVEDVPVGPAHAGGAQPDQHLPRPRVGDLHLTDLQPVAVPVVDSRPGCPRHQTRSLSTRAAGPSSARSYPPCPDLLLRTAESTRCDTPATTTAGTEAVSRLNADFVSSVCGLYSAM